MFGQYKEDLGQFARSEALRLKNLEKLRKTEERLSNKDLKPYTSECQRKCFNFLSRCWNSTFSKIGGEDWFFLLLLGVISSLISFAMDFGIQTFLRTRQWLYHDLASHLALKYIAWVFFPVLLILFSCGFAHTVAPQAIGSGIPEMKTILRGVVLKEYLTFQTLVAKVIGLTCTLGSGLPLGKEGPFVHISSLIATVLSKIIYSFKGIYENESRTSEMLAAACAVGVACTFAAPLGGVLFSIEVTSVFFAVRNYWRGFFAAACGALVWQLLGVWLREQDTITAVFRTNFRMDFPFDLAELLVYAAMGAACGVLGAAFVYLHKRIVLFNRKHKRMSAFLQRNRFLYPLIITTLISTVTFPPFLGKYMASELTTHEAIHDLFSNFTWGSTDLGVDEMIVVQRWQENPLDSFHLTLIMFVLMNLWMTALAATIPVPLGLFIPVFKMGAAFGRLIGESIAQYCPQGIRVDTSQDSGHNLVIPGGYAVAGAAAMAGAATRTISTCVIAFEMTGQMSHILPVMIAVLIANAISQMLQPSVYDLIITLKKLPYLPPILSTSSHAHTIYVEDIMVRDIAYIWQGATYRDLKQLLKDNKRLMCFPFVESPHSMILLGSIPRVELLRLLELQLGRFRRLEEVARRRSQDVSGRSPRGDQRRMSRFVVSPVTSTNSAKPSPKSSPPPSPPVTPRVVPKKSILKDHGLTIYGTSTRDYQSPYATVTSYDSRLRQAFEAISRKLLTLPDANPSPSDGESSNPATPQLVKRVQLPRERVIDMSPEEQLSWEEEQLSQGVNYAECHIDPAPFQLVERTTLIKVHSIFSMLGLQHAYVTAIGRLIGVVSLKELRKAIEKMNTGGFSRESKKEVEDHYQTQRKFSALPGHGAPSTPSDFIHPVRGTRPSGGKINSEGGATSEGETTEDEFDGNVDNNRTKGTPSGDNTIG
ncbi:chloride channel protein 2-like isoform X2 [Varroa jacobsoni]|nr:chloride channel protein 2-like isoform X2 [Varroa destructor]XP_022694071.1 chloride channel protein 2-like isoform X2 [Varroa jacobsoni]